MERMTDSTTVVQARIPRQEARQLDQDVAALGLSNRSQAVRQALRLLHKQAREATLQRSYAEFYGETEAPLGDMAAVGDQIAAEVIDAAATDH
jgi:Arc/MetJ-type ribon-helix-helix transcriptional regulator